MCGRAYSHSSIWSYNSCLRSQGLLFVLLLPSSVLLLLSLFPGCSSFPTNLEPQMVAPADSREGWYHRLFLSDKVFSDSFRSACCFCFVHFSASHWFMSRSDRIKAKLVPHLRSQVAWQRVLIAREDPSGRPHDGYSSLQLLEALDHVTFVNSELAVNCHVTCHKMGLMCSKRWAFAINTCDIMKVTNHASLFASHHR